MDEQQQGAPVGNGMPTPPTATPGHSSMGSIIGAIIVIAILAVGGLYYWGAELQKERAGSLSNEQEYTPREGAEDTAPTTDELLKVSTSDELADIEKDIEGSNFNNLGAGVEGAFSL